MEHLIKDTKKRTADRRSEPGDQYIMPVLITVTLIVIVMIADGLSGWRLHELLAELVVRVRN